MPAESNGSPSRLQIPAVTFSDLFQSRTIFYSAVAWWSYWGRYDLTLVRACFNVDRFRAYGDIFGSAVMFLVIAAAVVVVHKVKA